MQFRTDINGLRAYAVIAIMIFHFNKQWLPGAVAAVDVFFVISGYLMTAIIFRGLNNNSFSLRKYFSARIRRIIPALLVLTIILVILGYFFLGPISYRSLTKESIRSLLFISNFLYWRETGYFDPGAMSKFLLHTWTLSVEWQFYIFYPLLLVFLAKICSISTIKKIIITLAITFFLLTIYISNISPMTAYYLLPGRVWDMLIGGLAFLFPLTITKRSHKYLLEGIGLILIVGSFFIFSEHTVWPGYSVFIPTIGVFLLIQSNSCSFFTNNIVFQKIGLWSFSMYLYHWPILVINHRYNLDMSFGFFIGLTFLFAVPSYYLIEVRKWNAKYILIAVFIALLPMYGVYKTKGAAFRIDNRYNITAEEFAIQYAGGGIIPSYEHSYINPKDNYEFDYTIIGDSYSSQYSKFFTKEKTSLSVWFAEACLFTMNHKVISQKRELKKCT
ncbi:acyltransferase family protein, partial [Wohlfahrtiimonas larvae]